MIPNKPQAILSLFEIRIFHHARNDGFHGRSIILIHKFDTKQTANRKVFHHARDDAFRGRSLAVLSNRRSRQPDASGRRPMAANQPPPLDVHRAPARYRSRGRFDRAYGHWNDSWLNEIIGLRSVASFSFPRPFAPNSASPLPFSQALTDAGAFNLVGRVGQWNRQPLRQIRGNDGCNTPHTSYRACREHPKRLIKPHALLRGLMFRFQNFPGRLQADHEADSKKIGWCGIGITRVIFPFPL